MAFGDLVRAAVNKFLVGSGRGSNEATLDQIFNQGGPQPLQRGGWHPRISTGTGIRTAWEYVCQCGMGYTLLEAEKFRDYKCRCGQTYDFAGRTGIRLSANKTERAATLRKFSGILTEADWSLKSTDGDWLPPDKQELVFRALRPLPAFGEKAFAGRILSTWDKEPSGDVEYEPGDPGMSGCGFGNPR
jgi:hypothetical protein